MQSPDEFNEDAIQKLVTAAKGGDVASYEVLVRYFSPRLISMVTGMIQNSHDAQDIVQDAMVRAYNALGRYEAKATFYTWLYRIAYNLTLNYVKSKKRKKQVSMDQMEEQTGLNTTEFIDRSATSDPERQLELEHLKKRLNKALQELSEKHRAVVTMFDIEGLPHAKIAEILNISEGTVRSRLHYAHRELQAKLSDN